MNGYSCVCEPGWTGERCSVNIDDCATDPCQNGGSCFVSVMYVGCHNTTSICTQFSCQDLIAGYFCACPPGWIDKNCTEDKDECATRPCLNGATCTVNETLKCTVTIMDTLLNFTGSAQ